jgi:NAD(P)-dependent dehydrogenase (short-subunit alcohol dehydrogenase family)
VGSDGKVVWVTGGSRGLGFAIARAFADQGAHVAVSGRDSERAAAAAAELGPEAIAVPLDVADADAAETAVQLILERYGRLDVAVAAAGISPVYTSAERISVEDWRWVIDVNLSGTFFTLRAAARPMLEAGRGALVAITSVLGRCGLPKLVAYGASKGGVEQLVKSLALEWVDRGVRVNAVAPGFVETDMSAGLRANEDLAARVLAPTPLKRMARPEEVVGAVLYLASDESSYTTGTSIAVDGGWSAG